MSVNKIAYGLALAGLITLASPAQAKGLEIPKKWGVQAGLFFPADSELKNALGDSWFRFGISPIDINVKKGWAIDPNIQVQYAHRYGSRMMVVPATIGFSSQFKLKDSDIRPYVAARVGVAYTDFRIWNGIDFDSDQTIVPTSNVEAGLIFGDSFQLSLRYDWFAKTSGYHFDGLTIQGKVILFRF